MAETEVRCPNCDSQLREGALEGLCARCLGRLLLAAPVQPHAHGPGRSGTVPLLEADEATPAPPGLAQPLSAWPPLGTSRFGDYELIEEIARGGMGVVFKARQVSLGRIVAVKMIHRAVLDQEDLLKRFRTEAKATAHLQHPNIVAIHEVGEIDGQPFFSMDYVPGQSLARLVRERLLPPAQAARYVRIIAGAIHYAHRQGILHRDLKPSNVLVDDNDEPRVTDFGLAKVMTGQTDVTIDGTVIGTPSYMPPEQARGHTSSMSARSDVYSLGAMLYDLLCGRPPFRAETPVETLRQVLEADPVAPRLLNPRAPRDLETIVLKCLQKEPSRRYASAHEVADELGHYLAGEPISARAVTRLERGWRWCRRRPALASAMAVALGLFMVVAVASPIAVFHISRARHLAEDRLYVSDMNLSQQALRASNLGRARDLLELHRPVAGTRDLRHWEWRYLWQQCQSQALSTFDPACGSIFSIGLAPAGDRIAIGSWDGSVTLWDATNHTRLKSLQGPQPWPAALAFSPRANGALVITGPRGKARVVWIDSDKPDATLPTEQGVRHMAFSRDGNRLATFSVGGHIAVWDMDSLGLLWKTDTSHTTDWHKGLAVLSPDGQWLGIGEPDGKVKLIELSRQTERWSLPPSGAGVTAMAFSPDAQSLALAYSASVPTITLRKVSTGEPTGTLQGHTAWISGLLYSPDGLILASSAADQTIRLWEVGRGEEMAALHGHLHEVWAMAMSGDGQQLVTGAKDGSVSRWRVPPRLQTRPVLTLAHSINSAHLTPDGRALVSLNSDRTVSMWDLETLQETSRLVGLGSNNIALALSTDGHVLASGNESGAIRLVKLARGETLGTLTGHKGGARPFQFVNSDQRLLSRDNSGTVRLWATDSCTELASWPLPGEAKGEVASPDGRFVAAGTPRGTVHLLDTLTGRLEALGHAHIRAVVGLAISPNSRLLVTASLDGDAKIWELPSRRLVVQLRGHLLGIHSVAFSHDGARLATASAGREAVKLWDVATRQEILTLEGSAGGFRGTEFSSEGRMLMAINEQGLVHLWRAPSFEEIALAEKAEPNR
jgi:WD40 repeat protein/tRNA A-37 threonylcarbamoyl transferase component Bud32